MIASAGCAGSAVIFSSSGVIGCQSSKAWSRRDEASRTTNAIKRSLARNMEVPREKWKRSLSVAVYTTIIAWPQGYSRTAASAAGEYFQVHAPKTRVQADELIFGGGSSVDGGNVGRLFPDSFKDGLHHSITPYGVELVKIGGAALGAGIKVLAQHGVSAMQPRFHHGIAHSKTFGSFRHAHLFHFTQHHHRPIGFRQMVDCLFQQFARLRSGRAVLRTGRGRFENGHKISVFRKGVKFFHPSAAALARQRLMNGDAGEPSGKSRLARKLAQVFIGADVSILHHVLSLAVIPQDNA